MQRAFQGQEVTDGDRVGVVVAVLVDSRRGLGGGVCCEAQIRWRDGSGTTFECVEDLEEWFEDDEPTTRLHRHR